MKNIFAMITGFLLAVVFLSPAYAGVPAPNDSESISKKIEQLKKRGDTEKLKEYTVKLLSKYQPEKILLVLQDAAIELGGCVYEDLLKAREDAKESVAEKLEPLNEILKQKKIDDDIDKKIHAVVKDMVDKGLNHIKGRMFGTFLSVAKKHHVTQKRVKKSLERLPEKLKKALGNKEGPTLIGFIDIIVNVKPQPAILNELVQKDGTTIALRHEKDGTVVVTIKQEGQIAQTFKAKNMKEFEQNHAQVKAIQAAVQAFKKAVKNARAAQGWGAIGVDD